MTDAMIIVGFIFMLLGGYVLTTDVHRDMMKTHPCFEQDCNW